MDWKTVEEQIVNENQHQWDWRATALSLANSSVGYEDQAFF
jgi:hypothetical protein